MVHVETGLRDQGKAERRQRIYDAVLAILCEEGLAALSTGRISTRAGLSVATLYNLIGGLDDIFDQLVLKLFDGFASALLEPVVIDSPVPTLEGFVEATYRYLAQREDVLRPVQQAIFQRSLIVGASNPVVNTAARSIGRLAEALVSLQRVGQLSGDADPRLLAEQMVICLTMLLENWSAGLISLERYRLGARYHFLLLVRAWATPASSAALDAAIRERQHELLVLESRRRPQRTKKESATR